MVNINTLTEEKMKKSIQALKDEFATIRTGRASAAIFDKLRVDYYGEKSPLSQVANISIPEARSIVIQPWDRSLMGEIEKAIRSSDLSLNPSNDGKVIRVSIPPLTEQRRKELVKHAKNLSEQSRVAIRNIRRDSIDSIKKAVKDGEMTEDEESRATDDIQKLTDRYIKDINSIVEVKEKEIMDV